MTKSIKSFLSVVIFISMAGILFEAPAQSKGVVMANQKEEEISPTEDLMREHGILDRLLLVYEKVIATIDSKNFSVPMLLQAVNIVKEFIEDYHEKSEENDIFPIFEKNKQQIELVKTLRLQHDRGRILMTQLREILKNKKMLDAKDKKIVKKLLKKFIVMYRPHKSREDTVLFPLVSMLISGKEFKNLGERFEDTEHERFGEDGFNKIVRKVERIEKHFGIYKLEQFTP